MDVQAKVFHQRPQRGEKQEEEEDQPPTVLEDGGDMSDQEEDDRRARGLKEDPTKTRSANRSTLATNTTNNKNPAQRVCAFWEEGMLTERGGKGSD